MIDDRCRACGSPHEEFSHMYCSSCRLAIDRLSGAELRFFETLLKRLEAAEDNARTAMENLRDHVESHGGAK